MAIGAMAWKSRLKAAVYASRSVDTAFLCLIDSPLSARTLWYSKAIKGKEQGCLGQVVGDVLQSRQDWYVKSACWSSTCVQQTEILEKTKSII